MHKNDTSKNSDRTKNTSGMKKRVAIIALIMAMASTSFGCSMLNKLNVSQVTQESTASDNKSSDTSVKNDYYAAINADVLKVHDAEKTGGWSYFQDMEEQGAKNQKAILEELLSKIDTLDQKSSEYKLARLYQLAKNTESSKEGIAYYNEILSTLMNTKNINEFMTEAAKLQKTYGMRSVINTEVYVSEQNPSEFEVYLTDLYFGVDAEDLQADDTKEENKYYYETYLAKLMQIAGSNEQEAKQKMKDVHAMLEKVAKTKKSGSVEKLNVSEVSKIYDNIDLYQYLGQIYKNLPEQVSVSDKSYLGMLNTYFTDENLEVLKNYMYAINLDQFANFLGSDVKAAYDTYQKEYIGDDENSDAEATAVSQVNELLKWEMGKAYTERYFDSSTKETAEQITNRIIQEYESMINDKTWLSPETKAKAIEKLKNIKVRIGAPENIDEYMNQTNLDDSKGYFYNYMQLKSEQSKSSYDAYGEQVDRSIWSVAPQELQPCYYPETNAIYIPVITFQEPYFSKDASYVKNLGTIGTTIAHEVTHAFDELGSQYDQNGDLVNWWTDSDKAEFDARKQQVIEYYNKYKTADGIETDGNQTVGENIADLGAMHVLSRIVKADNLDAKEFFESYANLWASTSNWMTDVLVSAVDEHAHDKVRVNAVLSATDLFYETYDIQEGDGMYIAKDKRAEIW